MNKTIGNTNITDIADINTTGEFVAIHNGNRYFGKFVNADVGTFYKGFNFVSPGSIFPTGIPFECLDAVFFVA